MVEYRALGVLTVTREGDPVAIGGPRQRRLVAMLLVHRNSVVSADRLADAVFEGNPTPAAATTLRSYVARLRRVLDAERRAPTLLTRPPGYVLEVPDSDFDAARFEALSEEGRSLIASGDAVPAASVLRDALALWRGGAYAEFADEHWALPEAQRLQELRLVTYEHLVDAELACGRAAEVIPQIESLVADHPLREAFRAKLVLALYRSGRQVHALRALEQHRSVLAEELGLDPSPELAELERQILVHDDALRLREPAGQPLRGYRLLERLGTGRGGTVHAATLPGVDRDLVVRIIRDGADSPEFVRSFEARAQRLASVRHDAIVPIHDHWREPGAAYVVMRRMRGGTLRARLERGDLRLASVLDVVVRIGGALELAADQGVTHGRVCAESVLFDDAGSPHLSDFVLVGHETVLPHDDVWAFAELVTECLTGSLAGSARPSAISPEVAAALDRADSVGTRPSMGELVASLVQALSGASALLRPPANPYKGLRAFDEADADDFFGRTALVEEMLRRLRRDDLLGRLILCVGPSGSGKSSVVRAGVLPRVRRGDVPGGQRWYVTAMLPGATPFKELAEALRRVAVVDIGSAVGELDADEQRVDAVLRQVVPEGGQLLLVIDQLEELFTLAPEAEQRLFLDAVMHALSAPDSRLRVVATLRADFYDRPLRFHRFGTAVPAATVGLPAMSAAELEAAVTEPAARAGVAVDRALVAAVVAAVVDEPAALPSLQFTLYELAERSTDRHLTFDAYEWLGGVDAAIASRAEELYCSFDEGRRHVVREVFERLVVVNTDGVLTRRRAPRSELAALTGQPVEEVTEAWAQARLLTLDRHPVSREPTVEVAHEALLTAWPRLRGWIEEDREAILALGQLREAAEAWVALDKDPGALYRGARLELSLDLVASRADSLPRHEREFLAASRDERDRELRREAERVERQARANRRLRLQLGVIAVALVLAVIVGSVAVQQRADAEREQRIATARELAAAAVANLDVDANRSILLAVEAIERTRAPDGSALREAEEALHAAVGAARLVLSVPGVGGLVDWSPDGATFVTEGPEDTGLIDLRDATTGESIRSWTGHGVDVNHVVFNADGSMLASTGDDGTARVWDPSTGTELARIDGSGEVWGPAFSHDGRLVAAAWGGGSAVQLMDLATGDVRRFVSVPDPWWTAFSPDGRHLAVTSMSKPSVAILDVETGTEAFRLAGHDWPVNSVKWSPDGRRLATGAHDGTARIWDATTGEERFTLHGHTGAIIDVDWSPDSTRLVTGSEDGTARVWEITDHGPRHLLTLSDQETANGLGGVAFAADGKHVLTGDMLITAAKIWDVSLAGDAEWANLPSSRVSLGAVAFTPDGHRVVATGEDGRTAVAWDADSQQELLTIGPFDELVWSIEVSPDGAMIAIVAGDTVSVRDAQTGEEVFAVRPGFVEGVAWSPDGELLAMSGPSAVVVDRSGVVVADLRDEDRLGAVAVAFSPDGRLIAVAGWPMGRPDPSAGRVRIWDWDRREIVGTIIATGVSLSFDPTGARIAIAMPFDHPTVWDVATGARVSTLTGHSGIVTDVRFSPDGTRLATGGTDATARLWDAESGAAQLALRSHSSPVSNVRFSPDGSRLASVAADGVARVWAVDLDDLLEIAHRSVTRTLTDEECRRYLHVERCTAP
jgi:WD40 repeat protein/DNA-binding SARP family transcriptional activator